MVAESGAEQPRKTQISADVSRQAMRLSQGFFIDIAHIHSQGLGLELGQTLAFLTIKWANVEDLASSWEERRPITVFAISQRLKLPYETARRHVSALIDANLCQRTAGGVQVRPDIYDVPAAEAALDQVNEVTRLYVQALADAGVPMPKEEVAGTYDPRRRIPQEAIHHFLELSEISHTIYGLNIIDALLFISVIKANTWHVTSDPETAQAYGGVDTIPPDELRRSITIYALAKQLALPYDTANRHAKKMLAGGLLLRDSRGGLFAPAAVLGSPRMTTGVGMVVEEIDRFLRALARLRRLPY